MAQFFNTPPPDLTNFQSLLRPWLNSIEHLCYSEVYEGRPLRRLRPVCVGIVKKKKVKRMNY